MATAAKDEPATTATATATAKPTPPAVALVGDDAAALSVADAKADFYTREVNGSKVLLRRDMWANMKALEEPVALVGPVVKGFQRGARTLGTPTANLSTETLGKAVDGVPSGVYCGWASVDKGPVYKTVVSIGWNPHFQDTTQRTVEPYIMHDFGHDFYGAELRLLVCAYMRGEFAFPSLEALIGAIQQDVDIAEERLAAAPLAGLASHDVFTAAASGGDTADSSNAATTAAAETTTTDAADSAAG